MLVKENMELLQLVEQAVEGKNESMIVCGCGCLRSLLGIHVSNSVLQVALQVLPQLLDRMNSVINLQEGQGAFTEMMTTVNMEENSKVVESDYI